MFVFVFVFVFVVHQRLTSQANSAHPDQQQKIRRQMPDSRCQAPISPDAMDGYQTPKLASFGASSIPPTASFFRPVSFRPVISSPNDLIVMADISGSQLPADTWRPSYRALSPGRMPEWIALEPPKFIAIAYLVVSRLIQSGRKTPHGRNTRSD
ncbi:hypothetical protein B0J13DRAFT_119884 [Dactylonectria estremocensis]|uniref:Uncharacterized protein n=1 Tax=Dactylonectria estremocensis TaxID=1079267 RepID=A0A9P9FDZ7_9HYPO|nr:hypothetical protein B0J13DRAFT_119884 [Dactylonectria estremocensis]